MTAKGEGGGASRTTDPAAGSSAATDVSLREHISQRLHDAELRLDQRHEDIREADWRLMQERDLRYKEQRDADRRLADARRDAQLLAQSLQREVDREHFAHLNEAAARSIEERSHFATRELVDSVRETLNLFKEEVNARLDREMGERAAKQELREGFRLNTGWIVGMIGVGIAAVSLYLSTNAG